jgi:hypothetical protein
MAVLARPRCVSLRSIATLAAAPHAGVAPPREANRTEHSSAFVTDLARENTVLCEQLVRLLDGEQHGYGRKPLARRISFWRFTSP